MDHEAIDKSNLVKITKELRKAMPNKLISYAGWSIGAFDKSHPKWGTNEHCGQDIKYLAEVKDDLDCVHVMAYDAGKEYDPKEAMKAYAKLMGGSQKVTCGLLIGKHGWGDCPEVRVTLEKAVNMATFAKENGFAGIMIWASTAEEEAKRMIPSIKKTIQSEDMRPKTP